MSKVKETVKRILSPKAVAYIHKRRATRHWKKQLKPRNPTYAQAEEIIDCDYFNVFGRHIDWDNPKTYNEKIKVAQLYDPSSIKTFLTDKLLVRDWVNHVVSEKECKLIPLVGAYNNIDEINFDELPDKYVMKMNNDSGSVYIHDEKHPVTEDLFLSYRYFFQKRNYCDAWFEMQYRDIIPKIVIEKHMGTDIRDYKFVCFNGKAISCRVDFNRFSGHTRNIYDKNWKLLPYRKGTYENNPKKIKKPSNYDKMWKLAEKLSKGFDQVRVDLYDINGQIYFGEMTFTNGNGVERFFPDKIDYRYGKYWKLDMKTIRARRAHLLKTGAHIKDR